MSDDEKEYTVTWVVKVKGTSPKQAAKRAAQFFISTVRNGDGMNLHTEEEHV